MRVSRVVLRFAGPALVLVVLGLSSGCCRQQAADTSATEAMTALAERAQSIWNEGDLELIDDLVAPGYVRHVVDISQDIVGSVEFGEAVVAFRTQFPDFHVAFDEVIIAGDRIVLRWTVTGTDTGAVGELPPTGMPIQISGASVIHVIDGKFAEEWMYYNEGTMMQQLGFTLVPPAMEVVEEAEE
ncbi:MAG: ester cyclase [Acidobacteria bacterium]|nr:ester cyclase [Acidobacteriota bacterium]